MDHIDMLIDEIKSVLKHELPPQYADSYDKFEDLTNRDLLRASFAVLDELRRKKDWHPSLKLVGLIDRYKAVF